MKTFFFEKKLKKQLWLRVIVKPVEVSVLERKMHDHAERQGTTLTPPTHAPTHMHTKPWVLRNQTVPHTLLHPPCWVLFSFPLPLPLPQLLSTRQKQILEERRERRNAHLKNRKTSQSQWASNNSSAGLFWKQHNLILCCTQLTIFQQVKITLKYCP